MHVRHTTTVAALTAHPFEPSPHRRCEGNNTSNNLAAPPKFRTMAGLNCGLYPVELVPEYLALAQVLHPAQRCSRRTPNIRSRAGACSSQSMRLPSSARPALAPKFGEFGPGLGEFPPDLPRLLAALRSDSSLPAEEVARIRMRVASAWPGPWMPVSG